MASPDKTTANAGQDEDDLEEVSWSDIEDDFDADDFSEDIDGGVQETPLEPRDSGVVSPGKKRKGGGVILGLGAVCLAAGGLYAAGMLPFSPKKPVTGAQSPAEVAENIASSQQDTALAVTVPLDAPQETLAMPDMQEAQQEDVAPQAQGEAPTDRTNEVLTPMPRGEALETVELSSLEEEEMLLPEEREAAPSDGLEEGLSLTDATPEGEPEGAADGSLQLPAEEESLSLPQDPALEEDKLLRETEKAFLPEDLSEEQIVEASAEEKISGDLPNELVLEETDEGLDIEEPAASPAPAESAESEVSEEKEAEETAVSTMPEPQKPQAEPQTPQKPQPSWKLRSAKPGSAVIYDSTSGEMKTVETGDTVEGLGRISAISVVDGKWIVQGSKGKVVQ